MVETTVNTSSKISQSIEIDHVTGESAVLSLSHDEGDIGQLPAQLQ